MISMTLLGVDRACSPERAFRPADTNPVTAAFTGWVPSITGGTHQGVVITGVLPAQYQGGTVSGATLSGTGRVDASFDGIVTTRVRKGVPAGATTSGSPPV